MSYLKNLMDHDSREYGWSYILIITFGMAAAVWAVFDVLPTHPFPCWLLVGLLIAAEIVCLISIISVTRRTLLLPKEIVE
ncbi:MAG TPA: hypothetical protein PKO27_11330 [Deltaproteobacteria bacterium]|nr:hypothetical protein [Deltaproteobacteria bacterium]